MAISIGKQDELDAQGDDRQQHPLVRIAGAIFSFEAAFLMFLYSNALEVILPPLPVDTTLLFGLISGLAFIYVVLRHGLYMPGVPVVFSIIVFFIWATFTWGWSPSRIIATKYLSYYFTFDLLCVVAGALVIASTRERMTRFLWLLLFYSLFIAVLGLYIFVQFGTFKYYEGWDGQRVYNNWGRAVSGGAIVAFVAALHARMASTRQWFFMALFLAMFFFILIASSRSALLGTAVGCLVALIAAIPKIHEGRMRISPTVLLAFFVVAFGLTGVIYAFITEQIHLDTIARFMQLFRQFQNPDLILGPNRFAYYGWAIDLWSNAPLLGNGIGAFSQLYLNREAFGVHAHNIFLEILGDLGFVGFVLFCIFMWTAIRHIRLEKVLHDPLYLCVFVLFCSRFTTAMVGAELANQYNMLAFISMLVLRSDVEKKERA